MPFKISRTLSVDKNIVAVVIIGIFFVAWRLGLRNICELYSLDDNRKIKQLLNTYLLDDNRKIK